MDLPQPLVLDADGINALAGHMDEWERRRGRVTVLTPHEGEFLRVGGNLSQGRTAAAEDFARRSGAVVVLKGPGTVVAGPDGRCRVNTTGNCGMAKGGSGDAGENIKWYFNKDTGVLSFKGSGEMYDWTSTEYYTDFPILNISYPS